MVELSWFCNARSPNSEYPNCTTAIKAAELRDFVPVLARLCSQRINMCLLECSGPYAEMPKLRLVLMKSLATYYQTIASQGPFLDDDAVYAVRESLSTALQCFARLTELAQQVKLKQWQQTPKHHYAEHIIEQAEFNNPRASWTYMSEDFVGRIHGFTKGVL